MVTATITSKGQVTIPKTVRESLRLHTGDRIAFIVRDQTEAVMKPVTKTVDQVFGRLHKIGQVSKTVAEMNLVIAQRMRDGNL
ncbi:MAG: type II toxin-antitoxin system PrlF family antitoxin [bacterium]